VVAPDQVLQLDPDRVGHAGALRPDAQPVAAVGQHLELVHVVGRARAGAVERRQRRWHAARVGADHPAERAVLVRRRVGTEGQAVPPLRLLAEVVEHHARLHARQAPFGIDLDDAVQVLRAIDDDRDIRALAGEARTAAARQHGAVVLAAHRNGRLDVLDRPGEDDADRNVAVVRAGGRVQHAVAGAEPDFALDLRAQRLCELGHRTANATASASLNSTPRPGRERSARTAPWAGSTKPSNRRRSTSTWSWNHSRWRSRGTARSAWVWMAGAVWPERSSSFASASAAAASRPV